MKNSWSMAVEIGVICNISILPKILNPWWNRYIKKRMQCIFFQHKFEEKKSKYLWWQATSERGGPAATAPTGGWGCPSRTPRCPPPWAPCPSSLWWVPRPAPCIWTAVAAQCIQVGAYNIQFSVMKSDGNIFCRDVVSDSFNKTSRDEDNILDHIYKANTFGLLLWWF